MRKETELCEEIVSTIKNYCKKRSFRFKKPCVFCRYSAKALVKYPGETQCIFANTPDSWIIRR